jgi:hypothetical protein
LGFLLIENSLSICYHKEVSLDTGYRFADVV